MTRAHNESVMLQSRCSYSQARAIRLNSHDDRSADNNVKTLSKLGRMEFAAIAREFTGTRITITK